MHYDNYNLHCVISIHALLAESDVKLLLPLMRVLSFLSTLSLRRATANAVDQILPGHISIHALLAESDAFLPADRMSHQEFLSTLSLRRATLIIREYVSKT